MLPIQVPFFLFRSRSEYLFSCYDILFSAAFTIIHEQLQLAPTLCSRAATSEPRRLWNTWEHMGTHGHSMKRAPVTMQCRCPQVIMAALSKLLCGRLALIESLILTLEVW